jgi:hypothetical protein
MEQGGRRGLDLRQGDFAYTTDTSLFREKLVTVAVSVVLVLVFVALNAFMSLYALRKEEKLLKAQLKRASQAVFGEPLTNPRKVSSRVKRGSRPAASGIPDRSAFDILNMISRNVPASKKLKLDIARMDIKPGKTFIKGTADSRTQIGGMVKALEAVECFTNVTSGKISEVAQEKKQFTLTIDTDCF